MASAELRQIIGGGGTPIIKSRRDGAYKLTAAARCGRRRALGTKDIHHYNSDKTRKIDKNDGCITL